MNPPAGTTDEAAQGATGIGASGRGIDCFRIMRTFPSRGLVVSRIDLLKMTGASELRSLPRIPPLAGLKVPKTSRAWLPLLTTVRSSMTRRKASSRRVTQVNASATARRNREAFGGVYVSDGVAADSETDGSGEESKNCPVAEARVGIRLARAIVPGL